MDCSINDHIIAGIATAPGEAGIAIVRMSGSGAIKIADGIFRSSGPPPSQQPDRKVLHGKIHADNSSIDEVLLLVMRAPHSYTREDVVEIQCHGGTVSARRVLRCVLERGAKPSEPGEFTKRAFLNGRIDLLQAEAVLDLIKARSDRAAQSAMEQLEGRLSCVFGAIYDNLINRIAEMESRLDFADQDGDEISREQTFESLKLARAQIERALATWEEGHLLRDGAIVVITGRPNTGKSSLLNHLLGKDRAIVSQTPGTTRDTIEEAIIINGIPIRLVDTAGLRDPESEIEAHGINRARQQVARADIRVHLIDCSQQMDETDRSLLDGARSGKTIVALNKSDLHVTTYPSDIKEFVSLLISCITGDGINELKEMIIQQLDVSGVASSHGVISERHRAILASALSDVDAVLGMGVVQDEAVAVSCLRSAAQSVGRILGRSYSDDMLDTIFSRFCIGK